MNTEIFIATTLGYIIGSIPFGLLLSKIAGYGDIRAIGSGNIGATNVLRTGNKKLALATLLLDGGKGAIAVLFISLFAKHQDAALLAGVMAIIGHMFPVWLKFKGGKGVATTLGTYLAAAPYVGVFACVTWLIVALLTRYSSLAALIALLLSPIAANFIYDNDTLNAACGFIALIVWFKHRSNIKRLIIGAEPKVGKKKS